MCKCSTVARSQGHDNGSSFPAYLFTDYERNGDWPRSSSHILERASLNMNVTYDEGFFWLLELFAPGRINMVEARRTKQCIDTTTLRSALERLANRHPSLRSRFPVKNGSLTRRVNKLARIDLTHIDLTHLDEVDQERQITEYVAGEHTKRLGLRTIPPWRLTAISLARDDWVLVLTVHHILVDPTSFAIIWAELAAELALLSSYQAAEDGVMSPSTSLVTPPTVVPIESGHSDARSLKRAQDFWRSYLRGAPLACSLPASVPAAAESGSLNGSGAGGRLDAQEYLELSSLARQRGYSLNMMILGALAISIAALSRQEDIMLMTTASQRHGKLRGAVRFLVNTVPLRILVSPSDNFADLLDQIRESVLQVIQHSHVGYNVILHDVARNAARHHLRPFYSVYFQTRPSQLDHPSYLDDPGWPFFSPPRHGFSEDYNSDVSVQNQPATDVLAGQPAHMRELYPGGAAIWAHDSGSSISIGGPAPGVIHSAMAYALQLITSRKEVLEAVSVRDLIASIRHELRWQPNPGPSILGFRIDPMVLSEAIKSHEEVADCEIFLDSQGDDIGPRIVALVQSTGAGRPTVSDLVQTIQKSLPGYVIPSLFVQAPEGAIGDLRSGQAIDLTRYAPLSYGQEYHRPEAKSADLISLCSNFLGERGIKANEDIVTTVLILDGLSRGQFTESK